MRTRKQQIPPMTVEEFFEKMLRWQKRHPDHIGREPRLSIWPEEKARGGGWRCDGRACVAHGDTVAEAIRACFDAETRRPSRRTRLNEPHTGHSWAEVDWGAKRISYDYRAKDATFKDWQRREQAARAAANNAA